MSIDTQSIAKQINEALAACRARNPRAKVRTLEPGERDYAAHLDRAIAQARPDEDRLVLREVADFVANSYGPGAQGDRLDVVVNLVTGEVTVSAGRGAAPSAPHGVGTRLAIQLIRAGKVRGRYV